ncbi:DNA polymerase III subunit delta [Bacillaceae bacterium S4-13-58]
MDYVTIMQQLKSREYSPLYLVYGTENFLIESIQKTLIENVLSPDEMDVNLSIYDLDEVPVQIVMEDAETLPFFGDKKVIIAKNASFFKAKPESIVEHQIETLEHYLENPSDLSIVLFLAPYEKIDERKKIVKGFKKHGVVVPCEPLKEHDVKKWIDREAKQLNLRLDDQIPELLITENGVNLMSIGNEIRKMGLYAEGDYITLKDAEKVVSRTREASALKMVDLLMNQQVVQAIEWFKDLMKQNEEPIALLALVAYQYRIMLQSKILRAKGYHQSQIAQQLKVHPFVVKMALQRERRFSKESLHRAMDLIAETDATIKRGIMEPVLAFELMIMKLAQTTEEKI